MIERLLIFFFGDSRSINGVVDRWARLCMIIALANAPALIQAEPTCNLESEPSDSLPLTKEMNSFLTGFKCLDDQGRPIQPSPELDPIDEILIAEKYDVEYKKRYGQKRFENHQSKGLNQFASYRDIAIQQILATFSKQKRDLFRESEMEINQSAKKYAAHKKNPFKTAETSVCAAIKAFRLNLEEPFQVQELKLLSESGKVKMPVEIDSALFLKMKESQLQLLQANPALHQNDDLNVILSCEPELDSPNNQTRIYCMTPKMDVLTTEFIEKPRSKWLPMLIRVEAQKMNHGKHSGLTQSEVLKTLNIPAQSSKKISYRLVLVNPISSTKTEEVSKIKTLEVSLKPVLLKNNVVDVDLSPPTESVTEAIPVPTHSPPVVVPEKLKTEKGDTSSRPKTPKTLRTITLSGSAIDQATKLPITLCQIEIQAFRKVGSKTFDLGKFMTVTDKTGHYLIKHLPIDQNTLAGLSKGGQYLPNQGIAMNIRPGSNEHVQNIELMSVRDDLKNKAEQKANELRVKYREVKEKLLSETLIGDVNPNRNTTFLVDISPSLDGLPLKTIKQSIKFVLSQLKPDRTFSIIPMFGCEEGIERKSLIGLGASPRGLLKAKSFLDELISDSGKVNQFQIESDLETSLFSQKDLFHCAASPDCINLPLRKAIQRASSDQVYYLFTDGRFTDNSVTGRPSNPGKIISANQNKTGQIFNFFCIACQTQWPALIDWSTHSGGFYRSIKKEHLNPANVERYREEMRQIESQIQELNRKFDLSASPK